MLNNKTQFLLSFVFVAFTLFTAQVNAENNNQTTVTFKAAIVYPPCTYALNEKSVDLKCFNNDEYKMKSSSIDFTKQKKSSEWKELENNRSIYQFNWASSTKDLAILAVEQA